MGNNLQQKGFKHLCLYRARLADQSIFNIWQISEFNAQFINIIINLIRNERTQFTGRVIPRQMR